MNHLTKVHIFQKKGKMEFNTRWFILNAYHHATYESSPFTRESIRFNNLQQIFKQLNNKKK